MQSTTPSQRWESGIHWLVEAHNKEPLEQSLMAEMKSNMVVIISCIFFLIVQKLAENLIYTVGYKLASVWPLQALIFEDMQLHYWDAK